MLLRETTTAPTQSQTRRSAVAPTQSLPRPSELKQAARRRVHTSAPTVTPRNVHIRPSLCGQFTVVAEDYNVPLSDSTGFLPMDRRCSVNVYERPHTAKGAVLLIHGFASNRTMFDIGGGKGRSGPSFFEYLAQRGYDTFAIDLRGTRESLELGSLSPAYIREHIEIDVPSAITCIKKMGHSKVLLIGHSMGGAIACAVAGHIPHEVAGVVHLAGLYQLTTLPILRDVLDLYRSNCPDRVQTLISTTATFALRSFVRIFNPAITAISGVLSPDPLSNVPSIGRFHPAAQTSLPTQGAAASARYLATYIRRQRIPVRPVVDSLLFVRHFMPTVVSKAILNMLYPSPWLPYSVEDPVSFVDRALESPTVGICVSVSKSALHREIFNQWLEDSSHHRGDSAEQGKLASTSKNTHQGDLKTLRRTDVANANQNLPDTSSVHLKIEDDYDGTAETVQIRHQDSIRQTKQEIVQEVKLSYALHHGWDELGPYLDRFEQLKHLPLFFCPANADAILRAEDSVAGYHRSGSKWKEIIEYRDVPPRTNSNRSSTSEDGSTGISLANSGVATPVLMAAAAAAEEKTSAKLSLVLPYLGRLSAPATSSLASPPPSSGTPSPVVDSTDRLKRVSSGSSFVKSSLYSPTTSSSATSTTTRLSSPLDIEDDYDPLNLRYSVPASYKYGHCDILGGKHAELVWKKVVDWMDVTTAREKEWRFKRRYSAK
ncbi:Alpha/Beta hydrolase protein [Obelidium mucronatum]|nr:Alpha/Beta hydrolase protein [Obelidium mucronatum]